MRSALAITGIEIRRCVASWISPILLGITIYTALTSLIPGIGYWPNAVMAVNTSVVILGPLFAGVAAWAGGREARRGVTHLRTTAVVPAHWFPIVEFTGVLAWASAILAGTAVVVAVKVALTNPVGPIDPWAVLAGWLGVVAFTSLGYLAGRLSRGVLYVPPLIAAASYLLYVFDNGDHDWDLLDLVQVRLVDVFDGPRPGIYRDEVIWLAGLAACTLVGTVLTTTRGWRPLVYGAGSLGVATLGATLLLGYHGRYFATPKTSITYTCSSGTVTVCVHPAFRAAIPDLQARFTELATKLAGTPGEFTRLEQRPRGVGDEPSPGARPIHIDDWRPGRVDTVEQEFIDDLLDRDACLATDNVTAITLTRLVGDRLEARDTQRYDQPGRTAQKFLDGLTPNQRHTWLVAHYGAFTTCALQPTDFR